MDFNFEQNTILEDERVRLEPLTLNHLQKLLPIGLAHPELVQYSPISIKDEVNLTAFINRTLQTPNWYGFAIYDKLNDYYAGSTSYLNISNTNKTLEIGATWLDPKIQRTGLNRHCKFLLLQYAFEKLEFNRVEIKTDSRNEQSKVAIKKIGGTYEGILRKNTVMLDGYLRSTVYYSILKEEWSEIKSTIFSKMI